MTYFHYYATTSRNLDRVLQYAVFPLSYLTGYALFKEQDKANHFARVVSSGCYAALTSTFFALESEMIDANAREAVSAEMGVDPGSLKFSDYRDSSNVIVRRAYEDILRLQKYRYGSDALFLVPSALQYAYTATGNKWPRFRDVRSNPEKHQLIDVVANGHNTWDFGVYAAKSVYWAYETYAINKTGHYEVVKLRENFESTGKDISSNDLLAIYQRARTDRGLEMISTREEYDAIRPLLKKMAEEYNKRSGFGTSELVYLIGLGKINIHEQDGHAISRTAVEQSYREIQKMLDIGLAGIREENRAKGQGNHLNSHDKSRTFADRLADYAFDKSKSVLDNFRGKGRIRRPEEYITARDPGELTSFDYHINR